MVLLLEVRTIQSKTEDVGAGKKAEAAWVDLDCGANVGILPA